MGAVVKSYMTNGLLIYCMVKYLHISSRIRKPFLIYDFATYFLFYQCTDCSVVISILTTCLTHVPSMCVISSCME